MAGSERRQVVGGDDEELVGAIPAEDGLGRELGAEHVGDLEDRRSPAAWPCVSLRSRKLSMSRSAIADGPAHGTGGLHRVGQRLDQAAVVHGPGERVTPPGFEQQRGTPADAALGGAEDEEEQDRGEGGRTQRDDDDLASHVVELAEDRGRVAPDPDDRDDLLVDLEREVLAQDLAAQGQGAPSPPNSLGAMIAALTRLSRAAWKSTEIGPADPVGPWLGEEQCAVRQAHLHAEVVGPLGERREIGLERRGPLGRR